MKIIVKWIQFFALSSALLLGGCASTKGSVLLGGLTGATVGAGTGAALAPRKKGKVALKGALIGGALGLAASYFAHQALEKRDRRVRRELLFNLENFGVDGLSGQNSPPSSSCSLLRENNAGL